MVMALVPLGPFLAVSSVALASPWLWFTVNGYLAAPFVGSEPLQRSIFGGDSERFIWLVAGLGGFLGWTIPLFAVTWWLRWHPVVSRASIRQPADTQRV